MRTYLYKLTSDRGGAPCAIPPAPNEEPLLTLAICKPAIRRTAQPGDRILGITSHSLANRGGYPLNAVIYAAIVTEGLEARDYFAPAGPFTHRPDCIYEFHQSNARAHHAGRSRLHSAAPHILKDLGTYPLYRNGRILLAHDFRYFGPAAVPIPPPPCANQRRRRIPRPGPPRLHRSRPGTPRSQHPLPPPLEAPHRPHPHPSRR